MSAKAIITSRGIPGYHYDKSEVMKLSSLSALSSMARLAGYASFAEMEAQRGKDPGQERPSVARAKERRPTPDRAPPARLGLRPRWARRPALDFLRPTTASDNASKSDNGFDPGGRR